MLSSPAWDQLLDGLEKTSSRLAETFNTLPLDVAGLRTSGPRCATRRAHWRRKNCLLRKPSASNGEALKQESARQNRSVLETSSVMALSAVRSLPGKARWLSASARVGATHAGKLVSTAILDHYSQTLAELREVGYLTYAKRQLSPYLSACVELFSPERHTLTQRVLGRFRRDKPV